MYTYTDLINDVKKEAEALRVHATSEERQRLIINRLEPENINNCIYGQMTGDCYSERACVLINNCACRYIKDSDLAEIQNDGFDRIARYINGAHVDDLHANRNGGYNVHYSAIEAYILLPEARNANLIAYLRGETETLDL